MLFRPTKKLADKLKLEKLRRALPPEQIFVDWSARLVVLQRTQVLVVCHTHSMYTVIFPGAGITTPEKFVQTALQNIQRWMTEDGFQLIYINLIAPFADKPRFATALNRSVTGFMNDLEHILKAIVAQNGVVDCEFMTKYANGVLYNMKGGLGNNGYSKPRDKIREIATMGTNSDK